MGKYALRQTLLVHGQSVHNQTADPVPDGAEELPVHPVLHIAEGDVRVGAFTGAHDLHGELGITDPAPDQGSVEHKSLYKSVPGSPHHLVLVRLAHASGRIGAAVDGEAFVIAVNEQAGDAGEQLDNHLLRVLHQPDLPVGEVFLGKFVDILGHVLGLQGGEALEDAENGVVLGEAVNKIQAAVTAPYMDHPVNHIKIGGHIQLLVEIVHVVC